MADGVSGFRQTVSRVAGCVRPHLVPALFLLAMAFAVYGGCFGHQFLTNWDDDKYITANETIRALGWVNLRTVFTTYYVGNYAPVQMLSYMADHALWGLRPAGFLFTNILLHALNGILVYLFVRSVTAEWLGAMTAAFIFVCHPVQVESVAWASQRKNVLAMFFFLLALMLYRRYRESGGAGSYAGSLASFVAALCTKSVAVILPPMLLLYDHCYASRNGVWQWLRDKIPYGVAAGGIALVALRSQAPELEGGRTGWHGGGPLATLLTMLPVLVRYLEMLVWPIDLSAVYAPAIRTGVDGAVVRSALLLMMVGWGGVVLYRRHRRHFFWYAVFWLGLLPVSQIVPLVTLMNDRYLYFPMLGAASLYGVLVVGVREWLRRRGRGAAVALLLVPLLLLPLLAHQRVAVWRDALTLWSDAARKEPASKYAWIGLAEAHHGRRDLDAALSAYLRALAIDPDYRDALNNLGVLYLEKGDALRGRPYLVRAIELYPGYFEAVYNLGKNFYVSGDLTTAEALFARAVALRPRSPEALAALGNLKLRLRHLDAAERYLLQAAGAGGETPEILYDRGCVAALRGDRAAALDLLERSFSRGYRDGDNVLKDNDLDSLRGLPEFHRLIERFFAERSRR